MDWDFVGVSKKDEKHLILGEYEHTFDDLHVSGHFLRIYTLSKIIKPPYTFEIWFFSQDPKEPKPSTTTYNIENLKKACIKLLGWFEDIKDNIKIQKVDEKIVNKFKK